ncbi:hypothetical protein SVAN01_03755 [Stagonosporopsis vannaccii]|nr:hypothetical protein SVAN01_03755 [Stagonosporopsis vannaccii]
MAEINGIAPGISAAGQALDIFAQQIRQWRVASDRLFDLCQGLAVCQHVFERWQHKWEVSDSQPTVYLRALFGLEGCQNIRLTLKSIYEISECLQDHVDEIIGRALRFQPDMSTQSRLRGKELVEECLQRIRRRSSWKYKFILSVWIRAESMAKSLRRLEIDLRVLESHTNYYLEKEHPDIFSATKYPPGRKLTLRFEADRSATVKDRITDTLAAQRDAELLHRASNSGDRIHIGLSVPRVHPKDFAFLLSLAGRTHDFLVRPVRITANAKDPRVPTQLSSAVPNLTATRRRPSSPCIIKPSSSTDGFELTTPPIPLLSALEPKAPLSTIFISRSTDLHSQTLYTRDQNALAVGIAQSALRLLGTPWLRSLDSTNIRWRRTADGQWTSMLTSVPSDAQTTRTLDAVCAAYTSNPRDLTRHTHIFRIGLVLAELCLKTRIRVSFNTHTQTITLIVRDGQDVREADVTQIAAEVDLRCNTFLGEMVFFCLGTLTDKTKLAERDVQGGYCGVVVSSAEGLERLVRMPRRRGTGKGESSRGSSSGRSPGRVMLGR